MLYMKKIAIVFVKLFYKKIEMNNKKIFLFIQ